ncbi:MAG: pyridoxal phosphate-dependent aminotransferase [Actinobacteria bacterium]|nr:pyridoxal phosphate-dependent aminotransferase [Actinomycetota bacterium]
MNEKPVDIKKYLSDRVLKLEESPTFALEKKVDMLDGQLKAKGDYVVRFGIGQPDFNTPDNIKDAAKTAIDQNKTKYTASTGIKELKQAIVDKLARDNKLDYGLENIFVGNGGKQVLDAIMRAFINPQDVILVPRPYWVSYTQQVVLSEGIPLEVDFNDLLKIEVVHLKSLIKQYESRIKCLILNSPSNPTGAVYNLKELKEIAQICVENNIFIISDEVYEKFIFGNAEHISAAGLGDEVKNITLTVNAVSKTYAMTGWRIGYIAAHQDIISQMTKIQDQSASNPCTPAQWAAVEALNGDQESVEAMRREYEKRRDYIYNRLNGIDGIKCSLPEGAFYVFPDVSSFYKGSVKNSFDFSSELLEKAYVAVVPGAAFGDDRFVRISYATTMDKIKEGMDRIEKFCGSLSR